MNDTPPPRAIEMLRQKCNVRGGLPRFRDRVARHLECTVAFFGSSQTANRGWAERTFALLTELYPEAQLLYQNLSQGGVSVEVASKFIASKVIPAQPNLLFLEYSPASLYSGAEMTASYLEDMLRDLGDALPDCDICYVHCCDELALKARLADGGYPLAHQHIEMLLEEYGITSINFIEEVAERIQAGTLIYDSAHFRELLKTNSREALRSRMHYSVEGHPLLITGDLVCTAVMEPALARCIDSETSFVRTSRPRHTAETPQLTLEALFAGFADDTTIIAQVGIARGVIPDLSRFSQLRRLELSGCVIENTELSFSSLQMLDTLNLQLCELTTTCPDVSGNSNLISLQLSQNQLYGAVPSFAENKNLSSLILGHNRFETLPAVWSLPEAEFIDLSNNLFTGSAPDFSNCPKLAAICLDRNSFTGLIPDFSGLPMQVAYLHHCGFTGYIPGSLKHESLRMFSADNTPLGTKAVRQILEDLVEVASVAGCPVKTISLQNCCTPESTEESLATLLRQAGWTVAL